MIKDSHYYSQFKTRSIASDPLDLAQKFAILESLYAEARELGKFSDDDLLLGLEDNIRLAAVLNATLYNSNPSDPSFRISTSAGTAGFWPNSV